MRKSETSDLRRTRPSPEGEGWGAIDESYTSMKTLPSSTMAG